MTSSILGHTILTEGLNNYAVVLTNQMDYLVLSDSIYQYKVIYGDLILKHENELPSELDAIHFHMHPINYIQTYPERYGFHNAMNMNDQLNQLQMEVEQLENQIQIVENEINDHHMEAEQLENGENSIII